LPLGIEIRTPQFAKGFSRLGNDHNQAGFPLNLAALRTSIRGDPCHGSSGNGAGQHQSRNHGQ
jgi:hypothetical protein